MGNMPREAFLPVTPEDVKERKWSDIDFVYVTGDAYVDHPSFGVSIISRVLEAEGFRVAILSQPDFRSTEDFKRFGRPRLGFLVTAGNIDSMVAHYTVSKKKRSYDYYSAGGKIGGRPDRAVIVYCNRIREAYGDIPIIVSGDLNSGENAPQSTSGYDSMIANGFTDVRYTAKCTTDTHTLHEYPILTEAEIYIPGNKPFRTIDYIFTYGQKPIVTEFSVLADDRARTTSDHCPLVAKFDI